MKIIYRPTGLALEYARIACNLYEGTCPHGCAYCWNRSMQKSGRLAGGEFRPKADALALLESDCDWLAARALKTGKFVPPILFSFVGDVYAPGATITREALQIVKCHGLSFSVLTKGGLAAARDFDLYDEGPTGDRFGQTVVFSKDGGGDPYGTCRSRFEPGASMLQPRHAAAAKAYDMGITTWLSLEPVCDAAQALDVIRWFAPVIHEFRLGPLNYGPLPDVKIVDAGFVSEAVPLLRESGHDNRGLPQSGGGAGRSLVGTAGRRGVA